jgi:hypothetical protein
MGPKLSVSVRVVLGMGILSLILAGEPGSAFIAAQ